MNNDETNAGPQPWIDPALEARVVAGVLGETSAFEASELERILADNPELAVFKRRIEAVHALVGAAVRPTRPKIQISPHRRKMLLEKLGGRPRSSKLKVFVLPRPFWWSSRNVIAVAASLVIGAVVVTFFGTMVVFKSKQEPPDFEGSSGGFAGDGNIPSAAPAFRVAVNVPPPSAPMSPMSQPAVVSSSTASTARMANMPSLTIAGGASTVADDRIASTRAAGAMVKPSIVQQPQEMAELKETDRADLIEQLSSEMMSKAVAVSDGAVRPLAKLNQEASEKEVAEGSKAALPAGTEALKDSGGKVEGYVQYGAPMVPATDAVAFARNGSTAAESKSDVDSSAPQAGDKLAAAQAGAIKAFTGGWGKGSGLGTGGRSDLASDEDRRQAGRDSVKDDAPASGAVTVTAGSPAVSANAKQSQDKKAPEPESVPVLGDAPVAGKLFARTAAAPAAKHAESEAKGDQEANKNRELPHKLEATSPRKTAQPKEQPSFQTETPTAKQPFSTFSLHVSDVSFQLAKDALARGAMPDPDRIRAEEFYNAFDYGDPAPGPGEEVSCRIEQCAHPFLQQRDLVRIALKVAAAGRAAGQPLRLTILLDTSGSMEREDRAASVRRALEVLASLLGPNDRVTLIGFARTPRLLAEQVPGDQAKKLVEIAARTPSEGGTNLELALALASELALKQKLPSAQNRIVLLTDGAANLGDADPARLARQIEKTRQRGISFDACGVGANGLNDEMLEALTRKGDGRYYFLNKPEDADAGFARQLAGALRPAAENVKVQVVFNPARVSQYRLVGFDKHLLKKEDFRNDKVQAAELSAEEAGVAVYQVETLPDGEGELGDVFVRFRDPANGQMVERSWTMPYDPKAPAFDKCAPSMQLAATAALLAERLRGDSRVDVNALAPAINSLRGQYPHQAKVGDLIRMFEKLRQ